MATNTRAHSLAAARPSSSQAAVTPSLEVNLQNPGVLRITTIGDILPIISVRRNKAGGLRLQIGDGSWVSYVSAQGVTLFEFVA